MLALAYYSTKVTRRDHFSTKDIVQWFVDASFHRPNMSRLLKSLSASRLVVQDKTNGTFRLHARAEQPLSEAYDKLLRSDSSEEIVHSDTVLPVSVMKGTRGYIESLAAQINSAYDSNVFDGCAVLMRRLIEICLIHAFEHSAPALDIKRPDGRYMDLADLIGHAKTNSALSLSKGTKALTLPRFRIHQTYAA